MSPIPCPYCNAIVAGPSPEGRCPKCDAPMVGATHVESAPAPATSVRAQNRATAWKIVVAMVALAGVTALYVVLTIDKRRENDHRKGFVPTTAPTAAPAESDLVGLLPASCNVLAVVQVGELRRNPLAKAALFDDAPKGIATLEEKLLQTVGLRLADVEQAAIGVAVGESLPKIYVVVRTARPYDPKKLLEPLRDAKAFTQRNRPAAQFPLAFVGDGVVWCAGERHVAFLFRAEPGGPGDDLEAFPPKARPDLEGTGPLLREIVRDRVPKQSLAWIAGDLNQAKALRDFLAIVGARPEAWRPILDARAFGLGLVVDRDATLLGHSLAASPKDLAALREATLGVDWREATSTKAEGPPPDANEAPWLVWQVRYDVDGLRRLFARGPGRKQDQ